MEYDFDYEGFMKMPSKKLNNSSFLLKIDLVTALPSARFLTNCPESNPSLQWKLQLFRRAINLSVFQTYNSILMRYLRAILLPSLLLLSLSTQAQDMNNEKLDEIIRSVSDTIQGGNGNWQFIVNGLPIFCLTDETNNRMRFVTPIQHIDEVTDAQMEECMEANFHSALDVRYAVSEDILWVAYIHPLKELQPEQAADAIAQVYNAALTFGTTYSSTYLSFPRTKPKTKKS